MAKREIGHCRNSIRRHDVVKPPSQFDGARIQLNEIKVRHRRLTGKWMCLALRVTRYVREIFSFKTADSRTRVHAMAHCYCCAKA